VVPHSRKTLCIDACKPVNLPEPIRVEESGGNRPEAVRMPARQTVAGIDDCWRIDDEWWRNEAVSRLYYVVRLASGQRLVIYKDLVSGNWYRQGY
jgi:hypothetical protein